jgi:hypothetical protein
MRGGRSGVLVLRGEPGAGKTALFEYTIDSAAGLRVAQVSGVESEMELAFAALPVRVVRPGWARDRGSVGCGAPGRPRLTARHFPQCHLVGEALDEDRAPQEEFVPRRRPVAELWNIRPSRGSVGEGDSPSRSSMSQAIF